MSETAGDGGIGPDTPVSAGLVHGLYLAGVVPAGRYLRAVRFARDDAAWALWARRAVLALGVGQVLAGVVFFFAYNWAALPAWAKLGGLQAGIVAAAVAAWVVGLARPVGRALLVGAAVLVGVTLAVFGQIYQTGADAYQLFVGWGLLILPWVLASASPALWLVWLVVVHVGVELWGMQVAVPEGRVSWAALHAGLAAFDAALLAGREVAAARGVAWVRPAWTRRVLLAMALGLLFAPALREVIEDGTAGGIPAVMLFVAATAGAGAVYARVVPDFAAFALAVLFGCVFLSAVAIDVAALAGAFDVLASWIVTAAIVAIFGAASMLLRAARAAMVGRGMAAERERTVAGLLAHLGVDGGGLPATMPEGAAAAGRDSAMPWYVEVIVGVGAWLAGVMLGGSVAGLLAVTLGIDEPAVPLLVIGLAAVAAGVAIRRRGGEHVFVRQFALSWSVGGQAMVLGAVLVETGSAWAAAAVAAALAAGLLPLVRDGLHQFVAAGIACGVTGYAVVEASPEHAAGVLAVLTVPPALVLLLYPTRPLDTRGMAYALLLAVPVLASLFDAPGVAPGLAGHWLARAVYIGALGWLLWLLLGEIDAGRPGVMVAAALAGALAALLSVGIVASLTLLLLAYLLGSRPLAGVGALGVVWFVALFYYQLDVTLLAKSGLLVAVGAAFLALWWALGRRAAA